MGKSSNNSLTISDIARIAKVSTTTVSRYLNGKYEYMSAETQETIRAAIEKNGYRPNQAARTLKTKKSNLIAVVSPRIAVQSSPLFLQGVDNILRNTNYDYTILSSGDDFSRECSCLDRCIDQQVDGILYSPTTENFNKAVSLAQSGVPIVLFDRYLPDWPYSAVYIDHRELIYGMMNHLFQNGYDEVALLAGTYSSVDTRYFREQAFLSYIKENKSAIVGRVLRFERGDCMSESIESILHEYLAEPNTGRRAILAIDMQSLHTVLKLKRKLSIQIPQDFAICGYDSLDWSSLFSPSITYLEQPLFEMGCEASKILLDLIAAGKEIRKTICIHGTLNIGESTQKNE